MSLNSSEPSSRTGYAMNPLDRLSERRDDIAYVEALMMEPSSRFVVVGRDKPILRLTEGGYEALFTRDEAHRLGAVRETVLLGRDANQAYFALLLDEHALVLREQPDEGALVDTAQLIVPGRLDLIVHDLRTIAVEGLLSRERVGLLGQAKSVLYWHARHRFCSACGAPTELSSAGWRRDCASCKAMHFPRTDPVVIMLAVRGDECLMGRQPRFNKGMYSALAGFLEPGETIEGAVRREIREESAIQVGRVAYHASQPWPFPASIMIGCIAEATSQAIEIDRAELEDCRWFTRLEVKAMLEGRHADGLLAPNPVAIAHRLLRDWAEGVTPQF